MNAIIGTLAALHFMIGIVMDRPIYAVGQIWEYQHRPQDEGSLVKIQQIEQSESGPIYHISMTGIRRNPGGPAIDVGHLPVSRETLDASVTRIAPASAAQGEFPDATEGIAIWREDKGGVFTIPLAQIVDNLLKTVP